MVVVLSWMLLLLSVLCLSFSQEARLDRRLARAETEAVTVRVLARSGVELVESLLLRAGDNAWDAPIEGWDGNPSLRCVQLGDGCFSVGHATASDTNPGTVYGVEDEERRIPVERLDLRMLTRIPGLSPGSETAILDALATNNRDLGTRLPLPAGLDARSRASLLRDVSPYAEGGVNINTASREVLIAIGAQPSAVDKILDRRDGSDGVAGTADDRPFTSLVLPEGGLAACELTSEEAASLSLLARTTLLTTVSTVFRVRSRGWITGHANYFEIEAVVRRSREGRLAIVEWKETWAE